MIPLSKSINTSDLFTPSRMHYKMKEKKETSGVEAHL